ncbi:unnamed protein product, partial [Didymodactylos carnosus]
MSVKRSLLVSDQQHSNNNVNGNDNSLISPPESPLPKIARTANNSEDDNYENEQLNGIESESEQGDECSDESIENISVDDIYRYQGLLKYYFRVPTRPTNDLTSVGTIIRTFTWTLLVHYKPDYEPYVSGSRDLGLFLKCEPEKQSPGWSIYANADLTLLHATDPKKNFVRYNTIRIEANIRADAPRNVEWDSKGHTNFVGLRNQGATCYMNSFLQTIYFTNKLRRAVYVLPTDSDDLSHSIPLALQKLFYDLQFTVHSVSTKKLTKSFGWDKPDEFMQHDIQEFCRVLLDRLESKMEGTTVEGVIPSLFQGQYVQYVRCTKVDHESSMKQLFYDVPLQVRNNANIYESFRDFCKCEILTGDNMYDAGQYGLQEAEKGVKFQKFPPVLCLHLLRFEFDFNSSQHRKINDRQDKCICSCVYTFYSDLDLSEFLEKPDCCPCKYKLMSVLVHSGDNSSGHYVAFISPELNGEWFKFDDEVVSRCAPTDALDRNFGGINDEDGSITYNTSAYMLVYIREDCRDDVLSDINMSVLPEHLISRIEYDKKIAIKRRQEINEGIWDVQIILEDDYYRHELFDLWNINERSDSTCILDSNQPKRIRYVQARRSETFRQFVQRLSDSLVVDILCDNLFEHNVVPTIFVEQKVFLNGVYKLMPFNKKDDILAFIKLYDPKSESLTYIGHFLFSIQNTLNQCMYEISIRLKFPKDTTYFIYEELQTVNCNQFTLIKESSYDFPFGQACHQPWHGAYLTVQVNDSKLQYYPLPRLDDYLKSLENRQKFSIINRDNPRNEILFELFLPSKTLIKDLIQLIAERIEYDKEKLVIFRPTIQPNLLGLKEYTHLSHMGTDNTLKDLWTNNRMVGQKKIFFKRLPFHYSEIDHRRPLRCFVNDTLKKDEQREIVLFGKKASTVGEFLEEVKYWIPAICSDKGTKQLRLIEVTQPAISSLSYIKVHPHSQMIEDLDINGIYRVEEIPYDELDLDKDTILIQVAHYTKDNSNTFSINLQPLFPFLLKVINNESYSDVKRRLQIKMGISNREFEK